MKILFLDFDGVINHTSEIDEKDVFEWRHFYSYKKNHRLVVRLLEYCNNNNIRVVVSSTWRMKFELIIPFFRKFGMERDLARNIFKYHTPIDYKLKGRGDEINAYLESIGEEIESFAIVDDEFHNITKFDNLKDSFVKIDSAVGFTEKDLVNTVIILNRR